MKRRLFAVFERELIGRKGLTVKRYTALRFNDVSAHKHEKLRQFGKHKRGRAAACGAAYCHNLAGKRRFAFGQSTAFLSNPG